MTRRAKFLSTSLAVVALFGAAWVWLAPPSVQKRRLADGSMLELRRVDYGDPLVAYPGGSMLDRALFRLLPKSMRQPALM